MLRSLLTPLMIDMYTNKYQLFLPRPLAGLGREERTKVEAQSDEGEGATNRPTSDKPHRPFRPDAPKKQIHLARPIGRNQTRTTNLALAPTVRRGDETNRPAPRDVGNQASKSFSTEEQGDGTEVTEQDSMALRAVFDRAVREAPRSFSSVS